ncbi:MAG TPA: hypothetical protein VHT92_00395 [Candidatus Cybelea sp.]|nr:hypothetical protein [Candidatus Cybelea sp.]
MVAIATFVLAALSSAVAQQPPPPGPEQPPPQSMPVAAPMQQPLQTGPCLDSLRAVPKVLQAPVSRGMQIVRIDQVLSTATMTPSEVIGFLYTLQDGSTWLGQRSKDYQSAADATAINRVLSATHVPGYTVTGFPPTTVYGVPTKHPQIFRVQIPPNAFGPLQIGVAPCVIWPSDRALPDPRM